MQLRFDFDRVQAVPVPVAAACASRPTPGLGGSVPSHPDLDPRRARGKTAYHAGLLAEAAVADHYLRAGYQRVAARWRGKAGEVDLIMRRGDLHVFVEVKASRDFARAAERISRCQMNRICRTACEFCGTLPTGQETEMRMDAALVDQLGRVEIIENAFGAA